MDKIWEIFVCFYETFLVCYLLQRKFGVSRAHLPQLILSLFAMVAALSTLTFLHITVAQRMLLMVLVYIAATLFAFGDGIKPKGYRTLLWAACYPIISALADNITFTIASFFVDYPLADIMQFSHAHIQFSLLYLLLCTILVWAVCRLGEQNPLFPLPVTFFLILLMGIGILATESILDISLSLGVTPSLAEPAKQLSFLCYIIFAMLFALIGILEYLGLVRRKNQELEQRERLAQLEEQQYELMVSTTASLREWKHDYQGQLRLIRTLIERKAYAELDEFASELDPALPSAGFLLSTGNVAVDAVISLRMMEAHRVGIPFHATVYLPEHIPLDNVCFSSLLANLLDNAIEGCQKVAQGEITLELKPFRKMLYISCINASDGTYRSGKNGMLLSTKRTANHGIGLRRMTQMVKQVGGSIELLPADKTFTVTIMLPLG